MLSGVRTDQSGFGPGFFLYTKTSKNQTIITGKRTGAAKREKGINGNVAETGPGFHRGF
jgi:hypothetical protein